MSLAKYQLRTLIVDGFSSCLWVGSFVMVFGTLDTSRSDWAIPAHHVYTNWRKSLNSSARTLSFRVDVWTQDLLHLDLVLVISLSFFPVVTGFFLVFTLIAVCRSGWMNEEGWSMPCNFRGYNHYGLLPAILYVCCVCLCLGIVVLLYFCPTAVTAHTLE